MLRQIRYLTRAWLAVLLTLGLAACDQAGSGPALTGLEPTGQTSMDLGFQPGWSSPNQKALLSLLETEETRIRNQEEMSEPLLDSLKVVWDDFRREGHEKYDSPLLMCQPQSYTADTRIIGPEGGSMGIGPHKLTIPRGALTQYTVITGEMPVSTQVGVKLSPHGLQFLKGAVLEIDYNHCYTPKGFSFELVYVDEANNILERPVSWDVKSETEVTGLIDHFSRYVVAYPD